LHSLLISLTHAHTFYLCQSYSKSTDNDYIQCLLQRIEIRRRLTINNKKVVSSENTKMQNMRLAIVEPMPARYSPPSGCCAGSKYIVLFTNRLLETRCFFKFRAPITYIQGVYLFNLQNCAASQSFLLCLLDGIPITCVSMTTLLNMFISTCTFLHLLCLCVCVCVCVC
jgi:hypothetical protein